MDALMIKRGLQKDGHYRSEELLSVPMAPPSDEPLQKRQTSFDCSGSGGVLGAGLRPASAACGSSAVQHLKVRLVEDGCVQLCKVVHGSTLISKLLNTKYLRRWETHQLNITENGIESKTRQGYMEWPVKFAEIREVDTIARWEAASKYCLRLALPCGQLVLQLSTPTARDQWYHSIRWKMRMHKSRTRLQELKKPDSLVQEVKAMIGVCLVAPLLGESIFQTPLDIVSSLLAKQQLWQDRLLREELLLTLTPLLERLHPGREVCEFLSCFCRDYPRSVLVQLRVAPIVERILKHNVDFSKFLHSRRLVQDFLLALSEQGSGCQATRDLILSIHGAGSVCPHPRMLPNLVAACLGAVFLLEGVRRRAPSSDCTPLACDEAQATRRQQFFVGVVAIASEYDDWRPGLALLLQPIPFPESALADPAFVRSLSPVLARTGSDRRCAVHKLVLGTKEEKDGWLDVVCPSSPSCPDEGTLWTNMLSTLLSCCCRRKGFIKSLLKVIDACQLMALRGDPTCQEVLCLMLEWGLIVDPQDQRVTVSTLVSTETGSQRYRALCDLMIQLRELQSAGGPQALSLPSRSTDLDLARMLSSGCFGNLETLSLAFTSVTSQCAQQLIKLPNLRCLNLWCTQFGDEGLLLITEHLHKLQSLNLCETYVTDKSLPALSALKELHTLNLNSTRLSENTLNHLQNQLPHLQALDVRYTDAW